MEEVWKDIEGYEGLYQISNLGRVKSLDRIIIDKNGNKKNIRGRYKHGSDNGHGYLTVMLNKDTTSVRRYIHRLVAQAFIPNPLKLPEVNHKDENRSNNVVTNLEWVDYLTNRIYGTRLDRLSESNIRHDSVRQYDIDFNFIAEYESGRKAADTLGSKCTATPIYACADKKINSAYGYIWRYIDDTDIYKIPNPTRLFKEIYQYNATTGECLNHFYNYNTASKKMNIHPVMIRKYIDSDKVIHNYFWTSVCLKEEEILKRINEIQKSPVIGVIKYGNRWYANLKLDNKTYKLGSYKNKEDAIKARLQKEFEIYGVYEAPQSHLFNKYLHTPSVKEEIKDYD